MSTTRLELLPESSDTPDRLAEKAEIEELLQRELQSFKKTLSGKK